MRGTKKAWCLAQRTALLEDLIKQDNVFEWTVNYQKVWQELCLRRAPLLAIFDPREATKGSCDASQQGIGAAKVSSAIKGIGTTLLQCHNYSWKSVAHTSRALTKTEKK